MTGQDLARTRPRTVRRHRHPLPRHLRRRRARQRARLPRRGPPQRACDNASRACASIAAFASNRSRCTSSPPPACDSTSTVTASDSPTPCNSSSHACSCSTRWCDFTAATRTMPAMSPSCSPSCANSSALTTSPSSSSITCERAPPHTADRRCEAPVTSTPGPTARSICDPPAMASRSAPSIAMHPRRAASPPAALTPRRLTDPSRDPQHRAIESRPNLDSPSTAPRPAARHPAAQLPTAHPFAAARETTRQQPAPRRSSRRAATPWRAAPLSTRMVPGLRARTQPDRSHRPDLASPRSAFRSATP